MSRHVSIAEKICTQVLWFGCLSPHAFPVDAAAADRFDLFPLLNELQKGPNK